jgi:transposase-like protein
MLEVHMQTTVKTLFEKGYSKTQIAKMLEIDRKTVRPLTLKFCPKLARILTNGILNTR